MKTRWLIPALAATALSGCGLVGTTAATGAGAAASAQAAKDASAELEKAQAQIDAAQKASADRRESAEKSAE